MNAPLISVVETPEFAARASKLFTELERDQLIFTLAANPEAGVVIPETGGVRKLRCGSKGKGTRGGARVIYYFRDLKHPLILFTAYGKNEKADLSPIEKRELRRVVEAIKAKARRASR